MGFWDRVDQLIISQNTTYRWIAKKIVHKSETTVSGWRSQNVLPRADDAVAIAKALMATVEELVTGETTGGLPPDFLAACRILHDAGQLKNVQTLACCLAEEVKKEQSARAPSVG